MDDYVCMCMYLENKEGRLEVHTVGKAIAATRLYHYIYYTAYILYNVLCILHIMYIVHILHKNISLYVLVRQLMS